MSHDLVQKRFERSAADTPNIDSAGAVSEFSFPGPVRITKVGVTVTTSVVSDNSVNMTATLSRRPVTGSSSNAVTLGVFRIAAAGVDPAAGSVIWKQLAIADHDGETPEDYSATTSRAKRNEAPNSDITPVDSGGNPFDVYPGQSFAMTLDTNAEGDSGAVYSWVEYVQLPWTGPFVDGTNISRDTTND